MTPRSRRLALPATAVAVGLAAAGAAAASYPAPYAVKKQVAADTGVTPGCMQLDVSTVDTTWAVMWSRGGPTCHHVDPYGLVLNHVGAHWRTVIRLHHPPLACPFDRRVPAGVAKDLTLCTAPRTLIVCRYVAADTKTWKLWKYAPWDQPADCDLHLPREPIHWYLRLTNLKWAGWGTASATATAVATNSRRHRVTLRVRAHRRRLGCGGNGHDYGYTQLELAAPGVGTRTVRRPQTCRVVSS